jgi:ABC-type transport system involved in multi-copper enzyme maturation permease subunit
MTSIAENIFNYIMLSILKYILRNGLRDKLYLGLFITIAISLAIAIFLGSTMLVEQNQTRIVYFAGSCRTILSCGLILFVCITINRAFENKEIEFILSKAISREQFIIGYLLGFVVATIIILLPISIIAMLIFNICNLGLLYWFLTVLAENCIVICFALLSSLVLKNAFSAILSSFGFYAISRLMGMFVLAIELPERININSSNILAMSLKFLSVFFPRIDLYAQSSWLVYSNSINSAELLIVFFQSIIYLPLLIFMSFHDFKKKQF